MQPFYYQVHNPHSRLGFDLYEDSDSDDDDDSHRRHSTIKEDKESSEESHCAEHCSCCSSIDSSDESVYTSSSGKSDSISTAEEELSDKVNWLCHVKPIYNFYRRVVLSCFLEKAGKFIKF